jgi:hypothetical protein
MTSITSSASTFQGLTDIASARSSVDPAGFRLQIIDANGDEVGWAAGADQHELIADAKRKTAAHVSAPRQTVSTREWCSRIRFSASTVPVPHRQRSGMSILWIIIVVVLVLAVLGFFGRGRF